MKKACDGVNVGHKNRMTLVIVPLLTRVYH